MFWFAAAGAIVVMAVVPDVVQRIGRRIAFRRAWVRAEALAEQIAVEAAALREVEEMLWAAVEEDDEPAG